MDLQAGAVSQFSNFCKGEFQPREDDAVNDRCAQIAGGQQGLGERVLSGSLLPLQLVTLREHSANICRSGSELGKRQFDR